MEEAVCAILMPLPKLNHLERGRVLLLLQGGGNKRESPFIGKWVSLPLGIYNKIVKVASLDRFA